MINTDTNLNNIPRFFDGKRAAVHCISSALTSDEQVCIATAYFERSGFQALQNVLSGKKVKLLVGREEGGETTYERFYRSLSTSFPVVQWKIEHVPCARCWRHWNKA